MAGPREGPEVISEFVPHMCSCSRSWSSDPSNKHKKMVSTYRCSSRLCSEMLSSKLVQNHRKRSRWKSGYH